MKAIFKKAIATLLSIVMITTIFSNVVFAAESTRDLTPESEHNHEEVSDILYEEQSESTQSVYKTLVLDEELTVSLNPDDEPLLAYTPSEDGVYTFQSYSDQDTYGYLYDSNMNPLEENDDDGENNNFLIRYNLSAGETYYFRARFYDTSLKGSFPVKLSKFENPIDRIEFYPFEMKEYSNGYWCTYSSGDGNSETHFRYYWWDKLTYTVYMKNGEVINDVNGHYFNDKDGNSYTLETYDYQNNVNVWTVNNDYTVKLSLNDVQYETTVSIVENPIESVSFEPVTIIENTYGYWDTYWDETTESHAEYYYYNWTNKLQYTVTLKNGETHTGTGVDFYYEGNRYNFTSTSTQNSENQWTVGNTYNVDIIALGETYNIPVSIIEFPIEKIEFDPIEVEEYTNGDWYSQWISETDSNEEYYNYYIGNCINGATYKIFEKDGDVVEGTLNTYDIGNRIEYDGEQYYFVYDYHQNYYNKWTKGNTYSISVEFPDLALTSSLNISVIGRNFPELILGQEQSIQLIEGKDNYYAFTPSESGMYEIESFADCDPVVTLYNDKFQYISNEDYGGDNENFYLLCELEAGKTYYFKLRCYNHSDCSYPVKLSKFESPIESISFDSLELPEYSSGRWQSYWDGEDDDQYYFEYYWWNELSYTVYMKNGDIIECQGVGFNDNDYNYHYFSYSNDQYSNHWSLGDTHTVKLSLYGEDYEVPVSIIENPIESIAFNPISITENTNGSWNWYNIYDEDGNFVSEEKYYHYDWENKLSYTITLKNGETLTRTGTDFYIDNYNYRFNWSASQSSDYQWMVGNTYNIEVMALGGTYNVPVTIKENPIKKIEFAPVEIGEYTNGYWTYDHNYETGEKVEYYYYNDYKIEDITYTITRPDGTTATDKIKWDENEYSYYVELDGEKFYISANFYNQSAENRWLKGNSYNIDIYGLGEDVKLTIFIVDRKLPKIELNKSYVVNASEHAYFEFTPTTTGLYAFESDSKFDPYAYLYDSQMKQLAYNDDSNGWNFKLIYRLEAGVTYTFCAGNRQGENGDYTVKLRDLGFDIQNITFKTINAIENYYGSWDDGYFRYYWWNNLSFTITLTNGDIITSSGGGFHYNDEWFGISCSDNQYDEAWTVGNSYPATIDVFGTDYDVTVNVIKTPIESITIDPIYIVKETYGWERTVHSNDQLVGTYFFYEWFGRKLSYTIKFIDGTEYKGTGTHFEYDGRGYNLSYSDNQDYENRWLPGNTYTETLSALGYSTEVSISIVDEQEVDGIKFMIQNGCAIITGITGSGDNLVIPETLGECPVTAILSFEGNEYKEIVIPDTVVSISRDFLDRCDNLEKITIGAGIQYLTNDMFEYAYDLTEINVSENNEFYTSIDGVVYDKALTKMVTAPKDKTTSHTVPETVEDIEVYIKGYYDFEIVLLNDKTGYVHEDGILYNLDKTVVISCSPSKTGKYVMPNSVTEIEWSAFRGSKLSEVKVSNNVNEIVYYAFAESSNLTKVELPKSLTKISVGAFYDCTSLSDIELPDSLEVLDYKTFTNTAIKDITIPSKVETIGEEAFRGSALEKLTISEGVKNIDSLAFAGTKIKTLTLPNSMRNVSSMAFYNVPMTSLELGSGVEYIGISAFANTKITSLYVPASVRTIDEAAFLNAPIKTLTFAEGLEYIGESAFAGAKLESLKLPNSVTNIAYHSFANISSLKDIDLPDNLERLDGTNFNSSAWYAEQENGVVYIEKSLYNYKGEMPNNTTVAVKSDTRLIADYAFDLKTNLKSIYIPKTVKYIGEYAFADCSGLTDVYFEGTEKERATISVEWGNNLFENANWHYNASCPHNWKDATCATPKTCTACGATEGSTGSHDWIEATCSTPKTCNTCGATEGSALGHDWKAATCTSPKTCKTCDTTEGTAKGHNWQDATCTTPKFCLTCKTLEGTALGHNWQDATCTTPKTCTACDETEGTALGHDWKAATCTSPKTCNTCGSTEGKAKGHTSDNGTVTKKATCSATGTKTFKCTTCKTTIKTESIEKTAHTYDSGKVTKKATCKATGVKTYTCTVCKGTKTSTIAKTTTHTYDSGKVTKKATCKATGVKTYTCTVCKGTKTSTIAKTTTHTYDSGKVTKKATCKATGVKTYTCTVCKATKTSTIAKTHTFSNACDTSCNVCKATRKITHSYKNIITKATTAKNGKIVKKCSVCAKVASTTTIKYIKTIKLSATSYTYDGKVKKPSVTVKDSAGKTISSSYYTVTYASGRKNVGKYNVTIKFKGNYSGSKTLSFTINPVKTTVSKLTAGTKSLAVTVTKKTAQITGYQIQYSTNKNFSSAKSKTISSYNTTKTTLSGLSAKKTYYVRVRTYKKVGKTTYYSGWSTAKSLKTK